MTKMWVAVNVDDNEVFAVSKDLRKLKREIVMTIGGEGGPSASEILDAFTFERVSVVYPIAAINISNYKQKVKKWRQHYRIQKH